MKIINFEIYKNKWNMESEVIIKPGLESIQTALEKLGNPQLKHKAIHVAGTNGKGSTISFLSAIAKEHNLSYGSFTSPSIVDVHDQININGKNVTAEQMDKAFQKMQQFGLSGMLTEFELLTVTAFLVFEQEPLDVVFIEAGMGGRFDSTNVMDESVAVIPSISIDHTNFLGETVEEISWHKAGIMKKNSRLIVGQLPMEAKNVFLKEAEEKHVEVSQFGKDFIVTNHMFQMGDNRYTNLYPLMLGEHQLSNMSLAIASLIVSGFTLEEAKIQKGVSAAFLFGRMEQVDEHVFFDGAHNNASVDALVQTIRTFFPSKKIRFIVGILKDKDYVYMLRQLESVASSFEFVDFEHERALSASILYKHCLHSDKVLIGDVGKVDLSNEDEKVVTFVTGSLYLLTKLKEKIGN
ncbi:folylpolyglutamate synthase/dihydrofolate synthase family protein [Psychrobacillus sp.]|uniref:bifunctional folylpolyglutamate synthase/dihydrofolate synthase n=1 Tax=Psychrobacillus sp. TaxID=1871623 RepID=UPI0028BE0310|nr:folylpolyglutamate synthase/dihydrofolate synthase family protein [Psychrobacillus sp.]